MQPFIKHSGRVAFLDWTDVNTDLVIPARYLKRIERTGYGPLLFADKRYLPGGAPPPDAPEAHGPLDPDFPLNAPKYEGADVLLVGRNFGCGSSREHAVWAVAQAGFKVVVAPGKGEGFADIFEGNALNNGLLPVELDVEDWTALRDAIVARPETIVTIDLAQQTVMVPGGQRALRFAVSEDDRHRLLNGLDAIGETLAMEEQIANYEAGRAAWQTPATERLAITIQ